jgi:hypothetical protein
MAFAFSILMALLAQSSSAPQPSPTPRSPASDEECPSPSANTREIVICAQRPQGYRLNPDILEAKRELRSGGRPPRPVSERRIPEGTMPPPPLPGGLRAVNVVGVGLTAAEMAVRLAQGKDVGSMFVTDPNPSEYQLYLVAKARREAREQAEAEARAGAKAKAALAASQAATNPQSPRP